MNQLLSGILLLLFKRKTGKILPGGLIWFFPFVLLSSGVVAQSHIVSGTVYDAASGEPLPFANVFIPGRFTGTTTDLDGNYQINTGRRVDSLSASLLGYKSLTLALPQNETNPKVNFFLNRDDYNLGEVVITGDNDPAVLMVRAIIANKNRHNYARFPAISYEAYTKYEVDLDNITKEKLKDNILLSRFPHLVNHIDTMREGGVPVLPIFFIEHLSRNYRTNNPEKQMEKIDGVKMSGVQKQELITDLLSNVNQNLNIYENLITVLGKNFVSPIADYALNVYRYDLKMYDTLFIGGEPHLELIFKPRRKGENTFRGSMIVHLYDFAVKSVDMKISEDVNLSWVSELAFYQEFQKKRDAEGKTWFVPSREKLRLRFTYMTNKAAQMIGLKNKSYKDFEITPTLPDSLFSAYSVTDVHKEAYDRSDSFWIAGRHENLLTTEQGIYDMVDSLKRTKTFKVIVYSAQTLSSGFADFGPVGFGHVASIFSVNDVEGFRIRFGARTNRKFSQRMQFEGYGAYGFRDEDWKYYGRAQFILSRKPWNKIAFSVRKDIDLKSRYAEEMDQDNVFSLWQKRDAEQRFYMIREYKFVYDTDFYKDLTAWFTFQQRNIRPYFAFAYENGEKLIQEINSTEAGVTFRWQHKSKLLPGTFQRDAQANEFFGQFRKKANYPFVYLKYLQGFNKVYGDFRFHDLALGLQGDLNISAKQSLYYSLWAGKIFGTLPYLLLKIPEGNFTHVHSKYFFNNMSMLEFAADRYTSLHFQYFFGGALLDKIPLIKKLKLREVATANVFWGDVTPENSHFNRFNTFKVAAPIPYVEAGLGLENILKFIRVDGIYRFTYLDQKPVTRFAIYLSLFIRV